MKNMLWLSAGILVLLTLSACVAVPTTEPPATTVSNEVITNIPGDETPCTREYRPVCGEIQAQCIKAPCPPIKTSYPNRCMAENDGAKNIEEGFCPTEGPNLGGLCEEVGGKWLFDTYECEGINKEACDEIGGIHNECASACRNDPEAEICTLQCILVCQF